MKRTALAACFALAAGAVAVVAILATRSGPAAISPPSIPPARATVSRLAGPGLSLARQSGRRVVAVRLQRGASPRATVTVLGPEGQGVDGLAVRVGKGRAVACGHGCYRAALAAPVGRRLDVQVGAATVSFDLPARWPVSAAPILRKAETALRRARSVAYRERLESAPGHVISTLWRQVAPNRLSYTIAGGSSAVIIGAQRWDRPAGSARWLRSPQTPVSTPSLPWGTDVHNVILLDRVPLRIALFQPSTPAWYEVTLDPRTFHLLSVRMTAASHFMRDDYLAYDGVAGIAPPDSR